LSREYVYGYPDKGDNDAIIIIIIIIIIIMLVPLICGTYLLSQDEQYYQTDPIY